MVRVSHNDTVVRIATIVKVLFANNVNYDSQTMDCSTEKKWMFYGFEPVFTRSVQLANAHSSTK